MSPGILALGAVGIGFAATLFRPDADRARWAGCAVSILLIGVGLGLWWQTAPSGELGTLVTAPAQHPNGDMVSTVVTLENEMGVRRTHRVDLTRPVPGGAAALIGLLILGILGLFFSGSSARADEGHGRGFLVAVGGLVGLAGAFGLFFAGPKNAGGEAGVRQFLDTFDVGQLQFFSVPAESWTYASGAEVPLILAMVAALLGVLGSRLGAPKHISQWGLVVGAIVGAGACVWQTLLTNGVPWRALEGGLWASALLLGLAALCRQSAARASVLTAFAVVVAILGPLG